MSGTGKHGRWKSFLQDIGLVVGCIADGMTIFAQMLSLCVPVLQKWPVLILCEFIFMVTLIWCCLCMHENRKRKKKNDEGISKGKMYGLNNAEKVKRYEKHECKKKNYRERTRILTVVMSICLLFGTLNAYNLDKLVSENAETKKPDSYADSGESRELEDMLQTLLQTISQSEVTVSYEEIVNISFCLNESVIPSLEEQDTEKIFYVLYQDGGDVVVNHVDNLWAGDKTSGTWKLTKEEEGDIALASIKENFFTEKVEEAKAYKEKRKIDEWQDTVPDVCDYKTNVMEDRISIIDDGKADGEICFLVANNHQYIGNEYKSQNKEYEAVIYYWGKSIIYTEEGLMYGDLSEEQRNTYYRYLKARYKDIADYIGQVWNQIEEGDKEMYEEWRDAARRIYEEMP